MYICMYIYIYVYIYKLLIMYIYIYVYIYKLLICIICICIYIQICIIHICIYIYRLLICIMQCRDIFSLSGRYVSIRMHQHVDIGLWRLHVQRRLRRCAARAVRLLPHASWHTRPFKQGHHFGAGRRFRRHGEDGVSTMICVCMCVFVCSLHLSYLWRLTRVLDGREVSTHIMSYI